jgi:hypothetical protein
VGSYRYDYVTTEIHERKLIIPVLKKLPQPSKIS